MVPYYEMNNSVLCSMPSTVDLVSRDGACSPLTTPDDDNYNFELEEGPKEMAQEPIYVIKTKYDPSHKKNVKVEYKTSEEERHRYTEKERKLAKKAASSTSLDEFSKKVEYILSFFLRYRF